MPEVEQRSDTDVRSRLLSTVFAVTGVLCSITSFQMSKPDARGPTVPSRGGLKGGQLHCVSVSQDQVFGPVGTHTCDDRIIHSALDPRHQRSVLGALGMSSVSLFISLLKFCGGASLG